MGGLRGVYSSRWFIFLLVAGVVLVWSAAFRLPDDNLHVVACDVGQGDAILIWLESTQVLVDGGPNSRVIECLSEFVPFWDRKIEVVVLTHPQDDHMSGLVEVFERFEVEHLVMSGVMNKTESFEDFREAVSEEDVRIDIVKRGDELKVGSMVFKVLWPRERLGDVSFWESFDSAKILGSASESRDVNKSSVVLELVYGAFEVLLTGDIGLEVERALVAEGVLNDVDVLKVAHHGSKYSSSSEFLREIEPELAVISVSSRNSYGHPTSDSLMRLDEVGAKVLRTDELGDVEIVSDGERYWVEKK